MTADAPTNGDKHAANRLTEPYVMLPKAIMASRELSFPAKLIYAVVANRIGRNGKAWPGFRSIAVEIGAGSVGTAQRGIQELLEAGLIEVDRPDGNPCRKSNTYRLKVRTEGGYVLKADTYLETASARTFGGYRHVPLEGTELNQENKNKGTRSRAAIVLNRETWEWEGITDADRQLWGQAYPACDLSLELSKMAAWAKAAGPRGVKRRWASFITNWLSRTQDKGGSTTPSKQQEPRTGDGLDIYRRIKAKDAAKELGRQAQEVFG